jgi:hypothetical protein
MFSFKKVLMKHVWRLQQVGGILSVMMLSISITLSLKVYIFYIFQTVFEDIGVPTWIDYDYLMFFILTPTIFGMALGVGYLYDRTFQMWKAQNEVSVERNPYAKVMLSPKEVVVWQKNTIPLLRSIGNEKEAQFLQTWVDRSLSDNPGLRAEVAEVERWVNS